MDGNAALLQRVQQLEKENHELKIENTRLKKEAKNGAAPEVGEIPVGVSEFEETLRRFVQRTAMIVQAEKCVMVVRDRENEELFARTPAFGMSDAEVESFRVPLDRSGLSGEVFQRGQYALLANVEDPRAQVDKLATLRVRNGVAVPLIIEKYDDNNRLIESVVIGVLHCFNKRYGGEFVDEDVRLLERLSRSAAALLANAQMFEEIVQEKKHLAHTLESLTAGLILINQHQRIGQMNAQARAMFQITQEPIGKPYAEIIKHKECHELLSRKIAEADQPVACIAEDEIPQPDEITVVDAEGEEYIYQLHSARVQDDKGATIGTVFIFNDITDLRNVERMKTEFVSIVSHELRTPLTPMKGFVRTLLDDENEEWYTRDDRREFYDIIEKNVDRLGRLINDLLNVSRIERLGPKGIEMTWETVDIRKATEEVVDIQRGRTDRHTIVLDFEPETFVAETDPDKIQNILQNFVSNAIKYSPAGGEVRILGRLEPPSKEYPVGSVLMGVKDQGMGIPEQSLKKLGEKFFRATNKVGGTGIGLFLVKNLIARHNGHMWVESEVGKGSTFWFRFPVKQPEEDEE